MHLFRELNRRQQAGQVASVAVVGAGLIGHGIVQQIGATAGMKPVVVVNRSVENSVAAWVKMGYRADEIVQSDDFATLQSAIEAGRPTVARDIEVVAALPMLDAVVEATGHVEYGARVALAAIRNGKHIIAMNSELDATIGPLLNHKARQAGVVWSNCDGDQPGVLMRLIQWVQNTGFEITAAINCKGFLDAHATPISIHPWAVKQNMSDRMCCAFTDGTKMHVENAVVSNATGLVPEKRGMHGVHTDMAHAIADCEATFGRGGLVDYTLGGDFGGGVFVLGRSEDASRVGQYLSYLKMGDGPNYLFFRPYHLCHIEAPLSVGEALVYGEATIAPLGAPVSEVITLAKRDLRAGEELDGIGGFACYGEIDRVENTRGLLPVGLTENVRLTRDVPQDEPIPLDAVELNEEDLVVRLRREQEAVFGEVAPELAAR